MDSQKNFSLALGGWGARWLAHIGVIRRLEELGVQPVAISWTSMWAIVAALYAIGKTSLEMEQIIASLSLMKLIDVDMWQWLIKWDKVEKYLDTILESKTFNDTLIPLKILCTDLNTGKSIIFQSWPLSLAIRVSIWLPGVFVPKNIKNIEYIDGGITANLPIEVLPKWPVIAVSALRDITRPIKHKTKIFNWEVPIGIFAHTYQVMQKTIEIMLLQNESRSILSRKNILYIRPKFDTLDYYEFDKYLYFIKAGYIASSEIENFLTCEK